MKKGFTLIELMVSVAIFSMVMTVALGALLAISAAERKGETLKTVMDNLSLAMEGMTRTIRTGYNYHCGTSNSGPQDCGSSGDVYTSGQSYMSFVGIDGSNIAYCMDGGVIKRHVTAGSASTNCTDTSSFIPMTAPEIKISSLTFYIKGAPLGDGIQPRVTITVKGFVNITGTASTTFSLQTSVTQRIYDQ